MSAQGECGPQGDAMDGLGILFDQARAWCARVDSAERKQEAHDAYRALLTAGDQRARVDALHRNVGGICAQCHVHGKPGAPWPCATAAALADVKATA